MTNLSYAAYLNGKELDDVYIGGKQTDQIWGGDTLLWEKKPEILFNIITEYELANDEEDRYKTYTYRSEEGLLSKNNAGIYISKNEIEVGAYVENVEKLAAYGGTVVVYHITTTVYTAFKALTENARAFLNGDIRFLYKRKTWNPKGELTEDKEYESSMLYKEGDLHKSYMAENWFSSYVTYRKPHTVISGDNISIEEFKTKADLETWAQS